MTEQVVRRGRRDPQIAAQLAIESGQEDEAGINDDDEQELPLMFEGDVLGRKVTLDVIIDGRSQWVTAEARTRVYPGEPADMASERLRVMVMNDVAEQIDDAEALLLERAARKRQARIAPR